MSDKQKFDSDLGCIADYGFILVDYINEENEDLTEPKDFQRRYDEYYKERKFNKIVFCKKDNSLVSFFLQLTHYLQPAIGTVPVIDLNAYSSAIGFKIDKEI